ncbi:MAG: amidohydrolase [Gracilibacter sp. BRH_c7a]|nr:MAG: amidohydrolase [Gracilibacter sp. BRH_c7a]
MDIIDAHMHFSNITRFINTAKSISKVDYSGKGLKNEFLKSKVSMGIGMGVTELSEKTFPDSNSSNPMKLDLEDNIPENIKCCLGINPFSLNKQALEDIENELQQDHVVGFKIYPGYYQIEVYDQLYEPLYKLAQDYDLPVIIHSGDTYSFRGYFEYSHPLKINKLAIEHPEVNYVIAHMGNPWLMDAALVLSNNTNVYADLAGLIVGDSKKISALSDQQVFVENIQRALIYDDKVYQKILYGSDWPLVPIKPYINFIKKLVPKQYHKDVFYNNALRLFNLR